MCIKLEQSWLQQEWKFENWFANASHLHRNTYFYIFPSYFLRSKAEGENMERVDRKKLQNGKLKIQIQIQKYPMRSIFGISSLA